MKRRKITTALLGTAVVVLASACTAETQSANQEPPASTSATSPTVVAIGDSIPYNSPDDCPGCKGFVESYTEALSDRDGETYTAVNRSRHDGARTADILQEVQGGSLDAVLADAEVIIVSVGYNDQPPYGEGACSDQSINLDTVTGAADALLATTSDCITTHTEATGADLASVLQRVRTLAPDAPIMVLSAYNAWTGWPDFEALDPQIVEAASQTVADGLNAWQTRVCEEAEDIRGQCVNLLTAFNGPDGLNPSGDLLAADYTHPSQEGDDVIRDLLLEL